MTVNDRRSAGSFVLGALVPCTMAIFPNYCEFAILACVVVFWPLLCHYSRQAMIDLWAWRFRATDTTRFMATARVAHRRFVEWRG